MTDPMVILREKVRMRFQATSGSGKMYTTPSGTVMSLLFILKKDMDMKCQRIIFITNNPGEYAIYRKNPDP